MEGAGLIMLLFVIVLFAGNPLFDFNTLYL